MPIIKICCIASIEESRLAIDMGANAIGLVSDMPSGPGVITESEIAEIAAAVPSLVATFLLTSKTEADDIIGQQHRCRTNTIQICDRVDTSVLVKLRKALPDIDLVQVIHVTDSESIDEAKHLAPYVDALLLDSGNQNLDIKQLGGTGRTHDWSISAEIATSVLKPVYLAGGLNANNVTEAIKQVNPYGIDLCSGVRIDGDLDPDKLREFMALARQ